jgi:hypothetical protein
MTPNKKQPAAAKPLSAPITNAKQPGSRSSLPRSASAARQAVQDAIPQRIQAHHDKSAGLKAIRQPFWISICLIVMEVIRDGMNRVEDVP